MFDFRKLRVWQEGYELTLAVYNITRSFPRDELFGLTSQMRRAANSVPHNLAEGCGRASLNELLRFTVIAMGSASELESEALVAEGLGFMTTPEAQALLPRITSLRRQLTAFHQSLDRRRQQGGGSHQAPNLPSTQAPNEQKEDI